MPMRSWLRIQESPRVVSPLPLKTRSEKRDRPAPLGILVATRSALFAGDGVDESCVVGVGDIRLVDDGEASLYTPRQAGDAGVVGDRKFDRKVAHVERLLREHHRDVALVERLYGCLSGVVGNDLNLAAEASIDHGCASALGAEHVGAEYADEIGVLLDHRGGLLRRLVRVVEVVVWA